MTEIIFEVAAQILQGLVITRVILVEKMRRRRFLELEGYFWWGYSPTDVSFAFNFPLCSWLSY
jgi:hypothetical protein